MFSATFVPPSRPRSPSGTLDGQARRRSLHRGSMAAFRFRTPSLPLPDEGCLPYHARRIASPTTPPLHQLVLVERSTPHVEVQRRCLRSPKVLVGGMVLSSISCDGEAGRS